MTKVMRMRHMPPAQGAEVGRRQGGRRDRAAGSTPTGSCAWPRKNGAPITGDGRPIAGGTPVRVTKLEGLVLTVDAITG